MPFIEADGNGKTNAIRTNELLYHGYIKESSITILEAVVRSQSRWLAQPPQQPHWSLNAEANHASNAL